MAIQLQLVYLLAACGGILAHGRAHTTEVEASRSDSGDRSADKSAEFESSGSAPGEEAVPPMSVELINSLTPSAPTYFEGDIVLTDDQRYTLEAQYGVPSDPEEPLRAITRNEDRFWPDGKVPYYISSSLGSKAKSAIIAAINAYATKTCIEFYPRDSEKDYVYFFKGGGCYSSVGRVGGSQRISIGSGCEYRGIIMHEMFHALGRWHEQSRPDRDQFITVNYKNMDDGVESNFFKLSSSQVKTQGVEYDYGSIMHYSAYAFSRNGRPTIEAKDKSVSSSVMGQRSRLSEKDLQHIAALYCDVDRPASWGDWSGWSACSRSCNGGTRTRSRTCQGGSTCSGSSSEEEGCNTQTCPVTVVEWGEWGSWSGCSATCGGGRQSRTRHCQNGDICRGASTQYRDCNEQTCSVPEGTWSSWLPWSECSASCGSGRRTRQRECLSEPCDGSDSQSSNCNTEQCPTESPAEDGLHHEGCYRVLGGYGLFLLDGRDDDLKDNPFRRRKAVEKCAKAASKLSFSVIGVSAGYCISGNNRLSDYTTVPSTECKDGRGAYTKKPTAFYMDVYTIADPAAFNDVQSDPTAPRASEELTTSDGMRVEISQTCTLTVTIAIVGVILTLVY